MRFKYFLTFLIAITSSNLMAQTINHSDNHEDHKNEIGISNSPVYFFKEDALAYGLHIHYLRSIPKTKLAVGLSYERIFNEHKHNTFGPVLAYSPIEKLSFSVSPSLTFEDESSTTNFALHLETSYGFEFQNFHQCHLKPEF